MPLFTNYGKPKGQIVNFMKSIEQRFIPALNQRLNLNINNYPSLTRETYAVYEDEDRGVSVELSSNHIDIENRGDLFISVSYDGMKEDAGIVNMNDTQDAVNITTYTLQELGFKTPEDIEQDKINAENKAKQSEIDKSKEAEERARKREEILRQAEERNNQIDEPMLEPEPEEDTYDEDKEEYSKDLSRRLNYLSKTAEGSSIELEWLVLIDTGKNTSNVNHVEMTFTHVSGENFLIETKKINPKIQTICNIQDCMNYADKVSDKLRSTPTAIMKDEKGKDIELPKDMEEPEDDSEDNFSIDI